MHVGLSSVVQLNQKGAELRTIASLANMIRFAFFAAPGGEDRRRAEGRHRSRSLRAAPRATRSPPSRSSGSSSSRNDVDIREYGDSLKRLAALQGRRGQGDHAQRAVRDRRARRRAHAAGRPRRRTHPVAVLDPGGEPDVSQGEPRRAGAVPEGHRRGQLPCAGGARSAPSRCWPRARAWPIRRSSRSPMPTSRR